MSSVSLSFHVTTSPFPLCSRGLFPASTSCPSPSPDCWLSYYECHVTSEMSIVLTSDTLFYSLVIPHMQLFPVVLVNILDAHLTASCVSETFKLPLNWGCCSASGMKQPRNQRQHRHLGLRAGVSEASLCTVKEGSQMQLVGGIAPPWSVGVCIERKNGAFWSIVV